MAEIWYRGEAVGVPAATPGSTAPHDLADGMYLTDRADIATRYGELRSPDPAARRVYSVAIERQSLRVLDLTTDPRWQKLMQRPAPHLPGGEDLIKQANENYGRYFKAFVQSEKIDLNQYDAVIGYEYVRGGKQLCILFKNGKPAPLQIKLRSLFRPVVPREGAVPSAVPRGPLTRGGRIGPGLRAVGGTLLVLGVQILIGYLKGKLEQSFIEKKMKDLEPKIDQELARRIVEVAEIQLGGKKPYANITVRVREAALTTGFVEDGNQWLDPEIDLAEVTVSDRIIEKYEAPKLNELKWTSAWVEGTKACTYSIEVALSKEEVELYRAFKLEFQWLENQLRGLLANEDVLRLSQEKITLEERFRQALRQ